MVEKICKNCKYYMDSPGYNYGKCHRGPPVHDARLYDHAVFPTTKLGEWCGEWKPKEGSGEIKKPKEPGIE